MTGKLERCDQCDMEEHERLEAEGRERLPDILFIKGKPSRKDVRFTEAYDDKYGRVIRQIITALGANPGRCRYTYSCMCGSPNKKLPKKKELVACGGRLMQEIKDTNPRVIVTLGKPALLSLMFTGRFDDERGVYREIGGFGVIPTIDPEKLSGNPDMFLDLCTDLEYALDIAVHDKPPINKLPTKKYHFIDTQAKFDRAMNIIAKKKPKFTGVDLETSGLDFQTDEIFSISLTFKRGEAYIIDWYNLIRKKKKNYMKLNNFLTFTGCIYWNSMFDHLFLVHRGMTPNLVRDGMLEHYALDERQGSHRLKRVANDKYHIGKYDDVVEEKVRERRVARFTKDCKENVPPFKLHDWKDPEARKAIAIYNGADSDLTFRLAEDLEEELVQDHVDHVPKRLLIPAAKHFIDLKRDGVAIDKVYHEKLGNKWKKKLKSLEKKLQKDMGDKPFNLASHKQLNNFLFDTLGLRTMKSNSRDGMISQEEVMDEIAKIDNPEAQEYWHSASSAVFSRMKPRSTSMFMLFWLAEQHKFPRTLVDYRLTSNRLDTYYEGIIRCADAEYRIRPDTKLHGTRTGRLSSSNPNVHGTPRNNEIKRMYVADPGFDIIAADYEQAEIRMMAHFTKDDKLIEALYKMDIHTEIAKVLFAMTDEEWEALPKGKKKLRRRAAKTIAFGLIYGRGHKSIATQMNVSEADALDFIARYFSMMPMVRSWINRQHDYVLKHHEVKSLYGRKRRFPYIPDKKAASKAKRQAVNMPIQSSVSDMTLLANIDIISILREKKMKPKVGFMIHDGFFLQVPRECTDEAVEIIGKRMYDVGFKTDVPFTSEIEVGPTWGDLEKVA